jgi:hypothetical protein
VAAFSIFPQPAQDDAAQVCVSMAFVIGGAFVSGWDPGGSSVWRERPGSGTGSTKCGQADLKLVAPIEVVARFQAHSGARTFLTI